MCVVHVMSVLSVLQWREGGTERVCVCWACNERSVCVKWREGGTERVCVCCACNERSVCVTVAGGRYGESLCVLCM